ncbi:MAG: hypothetical protein K2F87_00125 [Muribaculaceae bacterium]|nr:hypothetical protein [Muribaculaceae bacterium]
MATNYVKVRPHVAEKLGVASARCTYPDGNYQLWEKDLMMVDRGWVLRVEETVARIGGVMFDPYRNREERERSPEDCVPLPEPTDPEWAAPVPESLPDGSDLSDESDQSDQSAPAEEGGAE